MAQDGNGVLAATHIPQFLVCNPYYTLGTHFFGSVRRAPANPAWSDGKPGLPHATALRPDPAESPGGFILWVSRSRPEANETCIAAPGG
jgi:hypothetical protein